MKANKALEDVAKSYPVSMAALVEAKACAAFGCLPSALEAEPGGFRDLALWLAARGVLEGLTRASLG